MVDKGAVERLEHVAATPFKRLSYTEAVAILEDVVRTKKKKFQYPVRSAPMQETKHLAPSGRQELRLYCPHVQCIISASFDTEQSFDQGGPWTLCPLSNWAILRSKL